MSSAPRHGRGMNLHLLAMPILAFPAPDDGGPSLNPLKVLGNTIVGSVTDAWTTAMLALWQAGLWMTKWVFGIVGALSTPDVSADGPLREILGTTLWISAKLALILMFVQLIVALVRRDGQSIGRVVLGVLQYGFVWACFLGCAAGFVTAAAGLEKGILRATLGVDVLSAYDLTAGWARDSVDAAAATILGITSILLLIPAAFFGLLIGLVRAAALIVLVAVMPITAAGLLAEATKPIFWKGLRWFIAGVLMSPSTALVLGTSVQVSKGVVHGAGDSTAAAIGTSLVGAVLVAVAVVCPLALFRLLAWVDPGTPSGAALRQSWSDAGGLAGLTGGWSAASGGLIGGAAMSSGAARQVGEDGRSAGEATAESATRSRLATAMSAFGSGIQVASTAAMRAGDLAADILGGAGVGSPGYSMTPADERAMRVGRSATGRADGDSGSDGSLRPGDDRSGGGPGDVPGTGPAGPPGTAGTPGSNGRAGSPRPSRPGAPSGGSPSGGGSGGGTGSAASKAAGTAVVP
jgi:type IV secretion system protein TrbL